MVMIDIPGCEGWVKIICTGGCITIHKILWGCLEKPYSNKKQLEKIKEMCEGKSFCRVQPSIELLGDDECPGANNYQMLMWATYSCDGGNDFTNDFIPRCLGYNETCKGDGLLSIVLSFPP